MVHKKFWDGAFYVIELALFADLSMKSPPPIRNDNLCSSRDMFTANTSDRHDMLMYTYLGESESCKNDACPRWDALSGTISKD